jgi:hypothetical protein
MEHVKLPVRVEGTNYSLLCDAVDKARAALALVGDDNA